MHLHFVDYAIIAIYFIFVLGIGFALRGRMKTSDDFFLSGRSIPGWITGLAFMSANLGALEVMGHAANAAKYGMFVNHFYWLAAMPAMCFVGVFMMPFYYGSKVRSVPEYLRKRYDEKTRTLNALSFALMTLLVSGIDLYAMAILFQRLLNWPFGASVVASAAVVAIYIYLGGLTSSIYNEVLQFFLIVFGFLPLAILGLKAVGRLCRAQGETAECRLRAYLGEHLACQPESHGDQLVRHDLRAGLCAFLRLLVYGLPGGPARLGGEGHARRTAHAPHCGCPEDVLSADGCSSRLGGHCA